MEELRLRKAWEEAKKLVEYEKSVWISEYMKLNNVNIDVALIAYDKLRQKNNIKGSGSISICPYCGRVL